MTHFRFSYLRIASSETRTEVAQFIKALRGYGRRNALIRCAALVAFIP
jgi:ATP:corrinoid adenosyltransferase